MSCSCFSDIIDTPSLFWPFNTITVYRQRLRCTDNDYGVQTTVTAYRQRVRCTDNGYGVQTTVTVYRQRVRCTDNHYGVQTTVLNAQFDRLLTATLRRKLMLRKLRKCFFLSFIPRRSKSSCFSSLNIRACTTKDWCSV